MPARALGVAFAELPVSEITPVAFAFPSRSAHEGRRESPCRPGAESILYVAEGLAARRGVCGWGGGGR